MTYSRGRAAIFQEGATGTGLGADRRVWISGPRRPCGSPRPGPCSGCTGSTAPSSPARPFPGSSWSTSPTGRSSSGPSGSTARSAERRCSILPAVRRCSSAAHRQPATEFNGLRLDLLGSFEPTPGTVAFLGYGSSLESDSEFNWSRLQRSERWILPEAGLSGEAVGAAA